MKNTALSILKSARNILEPEGAWIQGNMARDKHGNIVSPQARSAVRFCGYGALSRASRFRSEAFESFRRSIDGIVGFNDMPDTTQLQVLMAFDFAILMEEYRLAGV